MAVASGLRALPRGSAEALIISGHSGWNLDVGELFIVEGQLPRIALGLRLIGVAVGIGAGAGGRRYGSWRDLFGGIGRTPCPSSRILGVADPGILQYCVPSFSRVRAAPGPRGAVRWIVVLANWE